MPIRPELRPLYPPHWRELNSHVRFERAEGRCHLRPTNALRLQPHQRREHGQMIGDAVVRFIGQLACERDCQRKMSKRPKNSLLRA
jgi:hypothetical protein